MERRGKPKPSSDILARPRHARPRHAAPRSGGYKSNEAGPPWHSGCPAPRLSPQPSKHGYQHEAGECVQHAVQLAATSVRPIRHVILLALGKRKNCSAGEREKEGKLLETEDKSPRRYQSTEMCCVCKYVSALSSLLNCSLAQPFDMKFWPALSFFQYQCGWEQMIICVRCRLLGYSQVWTIHKLPNRLGNIFPIKERSAYLYRKRLSKIF